MYLWIVGLLCYHLTSLTKNNKSAFCPLLNYFIINPVPTSSEQSDRNICTWKSWHSINYHLIHGDTWNRMAWNGGKPSYRQRPYTAYQWATRGTTGHVTLVAITRTTLVPYHLSLQCIWSLGNRRFHLQIPYLQMSCRDLAKMVGYHRDHFVYTSSQWEMMLQCNVVSHWLGAYKMIPGTRAVVPAMAAAQHAPFVSYVTNK